VHVHCYYNNGQQIVKLTSTSCHLSDCRYCHPSSACMQLDKVQWQLNVEPVTLKYWICCLYWHTKTQCCSVLPSVLFLESWY